MKRLTNSLIKVISIVMAASLCASLVTACDEQKDDRTDFTTRETETGLMPNVSEPNQTINTVDPTETATATESTPAPAGKYTYTVYAGTEYETTLSMDVNIDDYLINIEGIGVPFFAVDYLWKDSGWLVNGDSNYDWFSTPFLYSSYAYGDTQMVWRYGDCYSSKDNSVGFKQLSSFIYHLAPIDNYEASANPSSGNDPLKYGIYVTFSQHPDDLCYATIFPESTAAISRDDAIVIAYVISSAKTRPGENPFAGTNLEKAQWQSSGDYLSYLLP